MSSSSSSRPNSLLPTPSSPPFSDDFIKKGEEREKQILQQLEFLPFLPFSKPKFLLYFPAHKPSITATLEAITPPNYKDFISLKPQGKYFLAFTQDPQPVIDFIKQNRNDIAVRFGHNFYIRSSTDITQCHVDFYGIPSNFSEEDINHIIFNLFQSPTQDLQGISVGNGPPGSLSDSVVTLSYSILPSLFLELYSAKKLKFNLGFFSFAIDIRPFDKLHFKSCPCCPAPVPISFCPLHHSSYKETPLPSDLMKHSKNNPFHSFGINKVHTNPEVNLPSPPQSNPPTPHYTNKSKSKDRIAFSGIPHNWLPGNFDSFLKEKGFSPRNVKVPVRFLGFGFASFPPKEFEELLKVRIYKQSNYTITMKVAYENNKYTNKNQNNTNNHNNTPPTPSPPTTAPTNPSAPPTSSSSSNSLNRANPFSFTFNPSSPSPSPSSSSSSSSSPSPPSPSPSSSPSSSSSSSLSPSPSSSSSPSSPPPSPSPSPSSPSSASLSSPSPSPPPSSSSASPSPSPSPSSPPAPSPSPLSSSPSSPNSPSISSPSSPSPPPSSPNIPHRWEDLDELPSQHIPNPFSKTDTAPEDVSSSSEEVDGSLSEEERSEEGRNKEVEEKGKEREGCDRGDESVEEGSEEEGPEKEGEVSEEIGAGEEGGRKESRGDELEELDIIDDRNEGGDTRTGSEEGEDADEIETPSSPIAIPSTPPSSPLDDIEESSPQPGSKRPASQLQGTPQKRNKPSLPSPEHPPNTQPPQITHDNNANKQLYPLFQ